MLSGLYRAYTAMDSVARQHEVLAHNLANLNVAGFKKSAVAFSSLQKNDGTINGTETTAPVIHHDAGPQVQTGRSLDVAIDGDAFFELQGPTGRLFTRNGSFKLNPDGRLVSSDGYPVVAAGGGTIDVPPNTDPTRIQINRQGDISFDNQPIDSLQLAIIDQKDLLVPVGHANFSAPDDLVVTANEDGETPSQVTQYALEHSNVVSVTEMIEMMSGMRHFESAQRAARTIDEAIRTYTNIDR